MDDKQLTVKVELATLLKRSLIFGLLMLMGMTVTINLHSKPGQALPSVVVTSTQRSNVDRTAADWLQRGKALYENGQFSEAIAVLQQAATSFEAQADQRSQAIALTYLAAVFEPLGRWAEANTAIEQAIALLTPFQGQSDTDSILAQALNTRGVLQLAQGQETAALATWQQAEAIYRKLNDSVGIVGSQMNQAKALQALGFYQRATALAQQVEKSLQSQSDSALKLAGIRNLGTVLQAIGDLKQARVLLQQSLTIAQKLQREQQIPEATLNMSNILLNLGNIARVQGDLDAALTFYRQAAAIALPTRKIQAQISQLSLLVQAERWKEAQTLWTQIQPHLAELPPGRPGIYAQIHLAQALVSETRHSSLTAFRVVPATEIAQLLAAAVQQSRRLSDRRAESYALGNLAHLYEQTQQWETARSLTQQALNLAEEINAPDIAYQWQWQLGRLLAQNERADVSPMPYKNAIASYTNAFNTLQSLRSDLVGINPDVQFSFRESVEPLYRQFVELLLRSPQATEPSQNNLKQARQVIESLQLAELDNFFREACLDARPAQIDQLDRQAAVIYPIILPDQFAIVVSLPNQPLSYYRAALSQAKVEQLLDKMQQSLRETAFGLCFDLVYGK